MAKPAKTKKVTMYLPVMSTKGACIWSWILYYTELEAWNSRPGVIGVMPVEVLVEDK